MEEGDHEDQGGVEQHGEIPEGTTGEGNQGAVSSLDADSRELDWLVLKNNTPNLSQVCFPSAACCFSMARRRNAQLTAVLLPSPSWGKPAGFSSLFLSSTSDNLSIWCLWWLLLPSPG